MFCSECGSNIKDGSRICPNCGNKIQLVSDVVKETQNRRPARAPRELAQNNKSVPNNSAAREEIVDPIKEPKLTPSDAVSTNGPKRDLKSRAKGAQNNEEKLKELKKNGVKIKYYGNKDSISFLQNYGFRDKSVEIGYMYDDAHEVSELCDDAAKTSDDTIIVFNIVNNDISIEEYMECIDNTLDYIYYRTIILAPGYTEDTSLISLFKEREYTNYIFALTQGTQISELEKGINNILLSNTDKKVLKKRKKYLETYSSDADFEDDDEEYLEEDTTVYQGEPQGVGKLPKKVFIPLVSVGLVFATIGVLTMCLTPVRTAFFNYIVNIFSVFG